MVLAAVMLTVVSGWTVVHRDDVTSGRHELSGPVLDGSSIADPARTDEVAAASDATPGPLVAPLGSRSALLSDEPASASIPAAVPVRIRLDRLEVDASVSPVGVEGSGDVDVPRSPTEIGWYRFGATPGASGSAVLVGHVDYGGARGSFFALGSARPGDVIDVVLADGTSRRFSVTERGQYPKPALPTGELFDQDVAPRLVLISCGGEFDRATRSYADNVVVVATPV